MIGKKLNCIYNVHFISIYNYSFIQNLIHKERCSKRDYLYIYRIRYSLTKGLKDEQKTKQLV